MYRITPTLLLFALFLPGVLNAQPPSVVTLFSEYCDGFFHFDGSLGASCSPEYIRKHASVVDERNGYLEISEGSFVVSDPAQSYVAAHYIHQDTHLLAVAIYDNNSAGPVGQSLKVYRWSGTELSDVTRERFAQMLSPDERNMACDDHGGTYNHTDKTWQGCWWEYVLPRNGPNVEVKLHILDGIDEQKVIDYTKYDFDLKSGTFERKL